MGRYRFCVGIVKGYSDSAPMTEYHMEKKVENEMETEVCFGRKGGGGSKECQASS